MTSIENEIKLVKASGLFDESWYIENYKDVALIAINPIKHYLQIGAKIGRNPSKSFDTAFYLEKYPDLKASGINPLLHYIKFGAKEGRTISRNQKAPPKLPNKIAGHADKKHNADTILLCAHTAGKHLFGSERSFLDLVKGIQLAGYNVITTIPTGSCEKYIHKLSDQSVNIYELDYSWWKKDSSIDSEIVSAFVSIIKQEKISIVHSNTIMLREPLIAARETKTPSVVHVRELIEYDIDLIKHIGESPDAIIDQVVAQADYIFANSNATAKIFAKKGRTIVVKNIISDDFFSIQKNPALEIRVGLISSNIPKKGIYDFIEIAKLVAKTNTDIKFYLYGPENNFIAKLKSDPVNIPSNIIFAGYVNSPTDALENLDIVLNLSHFQESFGRTVLEAMASGTAVVAYDWGAIPELITEGFNGHLATLKDIHKIASKIIELSADRRKIDALGHNGKSLAKKFYTANNLKEELQTAYEFIKNRNEFPLITAIIPNYNYEIFLSERLHSIIYQTIKPNEIIFLDDKSSDSSVAFAYSILKGKNIPFKIYNNEINKGTYHQWISGIYQSDSDYIWIAEADDSSELTFISNLLQNAHLNDDVSIYYCQSKVIDAEGHVIRETNHFHTNDLNKTHWENDFIINGTEEIKNNLTFRNSIPNVSACIFKSAAIKNHAYKTSNYKYCGDWYLYCLLLEKGKVYYSATPNNHFRRHTQSVTRSNSKSTDYMKELLSVASHNFNSHSYSSNDLKKFEQFFDRDYKFLEQTKNTLSTEFIEFKHNIAVNRNKRFLLITTNNGSYNGGSEVLWINAAMSLRRNGSDVLVIIKDWQPEPSFIGEFLRLGIKIAYKGNEEYFEIEKFSPDLTIISLGDQDEGIEWYDFLMQKNFDYVIVNQLTKSMSVWPIKAEKNFIVRRGYLGAKIVFFTCHNNKLLMESRLNTTLNNSKIHFNPFHLDRLSFANFPSLGDGLNIAMPARFLKIHKGQHLALEIFSKEKWINRNIHLNLYGDGPDRAEYEEYIAKNNLKNVSVYSRTPDIASIWQVNHAILMTSFMEGLPIVLVGAMISGRVPIVTDVGGHGEIIQDNISGFIAKHIDILALDDALERAYARRSEWKEIGIQARNSALNFIPENPVEDFIKKLPLPYFIEAENICE